MDEYVDPQNGRPRVEQGPVPAVGGHGGRYEFADRRMMTHLHELLMLPNAPNMDQKLAAICNPKGAAARAIVEWVAKNLGLTAIHPASGKEGWPAPEGTQPSDEKSRAGLAALRQRFGDLQSEDERCASEAGETASIQPSSSNQVAITAIMFYTSLAKPLPCSSQVASR
jgi:hypothetical protein